MPGATRSIVIAAPLERVFDVITSYERYPEFFPEVKKLTLSGRQGAQVNVHYEVDLMAKVKYTLRMNEERPHRVRWSFVEGQFLKDNKGSWELKDLGGGKTEATYAIEVALGPLVPKAVVNALVDSALPKMLESVKRHAETA
ncbi:MAG: type II toxin-antitoxin system RatA family toxin [Myxococcaceae bacterium]